jgi:hypothetical protein
MKRFLIVVMSCLIVSFACSVYGEDICKKAEKEYDETFSKYMSEINNEQLFLQSNDVGILNLDDIKKKKAKLKMRLEQLTEKLKVLSCSKNNNDKK